MPLIQWNGSSESSIHNNQDNRHPHPQWRRIWQVGGTRTRRMKIRQAWVLETRMAHRGQGVHLWYSISLPGWNLALDGLKSKTYRFHCAHLREIIRNLEIEIKNKYYLIQKKWSKFGSFDPKGHNGVKISRSYHIQFAGMNLSMASHLLQSLPVSCCIYGIQI